MKTLSVRKYRTSLVPSFTKMIVLKFKSSTVIISRTIGMGVSLFLLSWLLSSCSSLLDFASHYNDCAYPECDRRVRKGSSYCSHHDGNLIKNNIDNSLKNVRNQNKNK